MTRIEIEYCDPCGFLDRAEDVQHALLTNLAEEIDEVALVTGDHGIFQVRVGDDLVFDKAEDEFDVDEITRQVRSEL